MTRSTASSEHKPPGSTPGISAPASQRRHSSVGIAAQNRDYLLTLQPGCFTSRLQTIGLQPKPQTRVRPQYCKSQEAAISRFPSSMCCEGAEFSLLVFRHLNGTECGDRRR